MPLGEHKPVSSRLMRILRIDIHLRKIQISDDVRRGKRAAGVTGARGMNLSDDIDSDILCFFLQHFQIDCHVYWFLLKIIAAPHFEKCGIIYLNCDRLRRYLCSGQFFTGVKLRRVRTIFANDFSGTVQKFLFSSLSSASPKNHPQHENRQSQHPLKAGGLLNKPIKPLQTVIPVELRELSSGFPPHTSRLPPTPIAPRTEVNSWSVLCDKPLLFRRAQGHAEKIRAAVRTALR